MRRVVLLGLLAMALPTVALANSIDFTLGGSIGTSASTSGSLAVNSTYTVNSQLLDVNFVSTTGHAAVTTGALVSCGSGCFSFTGGTLDVWNGSNQLLFHGTFNGSITNVNGVITIMANQGGNPVVAGFQFVVGQTGVVSGDFNVVPEPSTLGLLGTGLVGLAGIVRRKLRA